jgi:metallo-beta-lactamase class B
MLRKALVLFAVAIASAAPAQPDDDRSAQRIAWNQPVEPFRVAGNVFYVGTAGLASYLVTGPEGHVLIDGALEESADQIAGNIRALGFRIEDVEVLLINHAHWDHAGGLAKLKQMSGARLLASAADRPELESGRTSWRPELLPFPPVKVDRTIEDGERLELGPIILTAHLTPGHTPGCTSWSTVTKDQGKRLDVLFTCSLTVAGQKLVEDAGYPRAAADFEASLAKLNRMRADVFLGFHPEGFNFEEKRRRLIGGDRSAFVDRGELQRQVERARIDFSLTRVNEAADGLERIADGLDD